MLSFISEEELEKHKEYHRQLSLKCSLLKRSEGKTEVRRRGRSEENELFALDTLHTVYFDSFSDKRFTPSARLRSDFGSESALLHKLFTDGIKLPYGFVGVCRGRRGLITFASENASQILALGTPILAVDVCEHAYYGDYGFDREAYLRCALAYLACDRADNYSSK